jgi:phosphoglycerol geranylgeranyltransferase
MKFEELLKKLRSGKKPMLAVLIDPDKFNPELVQLANESRVSCFLLGGSLLEKGDLNKTLKAIKKISDIPVVLFPGDEKQLSRGADGLLLLSLLSGRNPEYLIGKHVTAAPIIRRMKLPYLSTAYLLIGKAHKSSTQKVTRTNPIDPRNKRHIINTAIAAEQLGFGAVYLEGGSGSKRSLPAALIKTIRKEIALPLIVGGGIDSAQKTRDAIKAGANLVVIGNALEKNVYLLRDISLCF